MVVADNNHGSSSHPSMEQPLAAVPDDDERHELPRDYSGTASTQEDVESSDSSLEAAGSNVEVVVPDNIGNDGEGTADKSNHDAPGDTTVRVESGDGDGAEPDDVESNQVTAEGSAD
eukprot:CAMPEP_0116837302 /NCGR_PEP_ID=MMETSP0418-20121206/8577_1 /TAXON_ID=1158023 /ORGANISM="Astrosyne radiata, Strain 13vi08-1A" /LENGTH=116 /DNA_ID=CAMNT_0004467169 /DNA_START=373 /DNA_END=723 /DNA_ORIENTATION=-